MQAGLMSKENTGEKVKESEVTGSDWKVSG